VLFKLSRALERRQLQAEIGRLKAAAPLDTPGSAPAWRRALVASAEALAQGLDVYLVGEAGSGRASIGRAAHLVSPRRDAPFVCCDLAHLPPADQAQLLAGGEQPDGFWAATGHGTLLVRHVGHLTHAGADELIRLLARRAAHGVGPLLVLTGTAEEWATAPRLTHRHSDVAVPALRAHLDDLLLFAAAWLPNRQITPAATELLHAYNWPGNLGELRGVLERADRLATGGPINVQQLPDRVRAAPLPHTHPLTARGPLPGGARDFAAPAGARPRGRQQIARR